MRSERGENDSAPAEYGALTVRDKSRGAIQNDDRVWAMNCGSQVLPAGLHVDAAQLEFVRLESDRNVLRHLHAHHSAPHS